VADEKRTKSDELTRDAVRRAAEPSPRKPYRRPTVVRYGDVTTLTKSGTGSKNDKGSGAKTRTL
jgi:hypothetical protein